LYILESELDGSFYIGQSNDVSKRLITHNSGHNKSTKSRIPWHLLFSIEMESRSQAMKLEKKIKSWKKRSAIIEWINKQSRGVAPVRTEFIRADSLVSAPRLEIGRVGCSDPS
jgi:putative endonuclease